MAVPQPFFERVGDRLVRAIAHVERLPCGIDHPVPDVDGRQRHEPHAVGKLGHKGGCGLQGEPGLPTSAGAAQRHKPVGADRLGHLGHLSLTAHEGIDRRRDVVRCRQAPQRSECLRETRRPNLEKTEVTNVFEHMTPEIAGVWVTRELSGRLGDQDLPPVRRRRHPGCHVHREPDVVAADKVCLPRVQPHADPQWRVRRPRLLGQGALRCHRCRHARRRFLEHGEEGISLGSHDDTVVRLDRVIDEFAMAHQHGCIAVTEPVQQLSRAFDVGEKKGHDALWQRRCRH